jgi:hypothetical protein
MAISQVRAQVNGVWTVLTYNGATGKYEANVTAPSTTSFNLVGGYYPIVVEATNTAGTVVTKNKDDATLGASLRLVVKELTKPVITITSPGASAKVTNAAQPVVFQLRDESGGSGIAIGTLKLQFDTGTIFTNASTGMSITQVTNGYDVTYTPQTGLTDGSHTVKIDIKDNDGNSATQSTRTYTVDTVPPVLNVTAPTTGFIRNTAAVSVVGITNDITSSPVVVTVKLNGIDQGTVTLDGSGNFSKAITLAEGANTIIIRSTDAAGKYSEITITGTLDTSVPTISSVTITPNPANSGATVLISVAVSG